VADQRSVAFETEQRGAGVTSEVTVDTKFFFGVMLHSHFGLTRAEFATRMVQPALRRGPRENYFQIGDVW